MFYLSQEEKVKTKLNKIIRDDKKAIYGSLTRTIEKNMQESYESKIKHLNKRNLTL